MRIPSFALEDLGLQKEAAYKAKAAGPGGKIQLKSFAKNLLHGNKAHQTSEAMKALTSGSGFNFDEAKMKRKAAAKQQRRPKVGLSNPEMRPKLFRKGGPKKLPASTPKNAAGFQVHTPTKGTPSRGR